jgi:hypothetical protein
VRADTTPLEPLVNARVELTGSGGQAIARTDSSGRFTFTGLPAGAFRLRVTKDGYLRQEYRQLGLDKPGNPILLTAGQQLQNAAFRMDPAPTIAGVVRDPAQIPLRGAIVQALKRGYDARGNRSLKVIASTVSDDRGAYRLFWLDPGEYFVSATPPPPAPGTEVRTSAFAPTYFSGFVDIDAAKPVRLDRGRDATAIDFRVFGQAALNLNGYVSTRLMGAVAANIVVVSPEDGAGVAKFSGKSTPRDGYFIEGVPPGGYILSATFGKESGFARARVRNVPNARGGRDAGLRVDLVLSEGLTVGGRVIADSPTDLKNARVHLSEVDPAFPEPAVVAIGANGQFSLPAVQPGSYVVGVDGLINDQYLKNVVAGGRDVLDQPLPVAFGAALPELQIQIGTDGGRITGAVYDRNNALYANAEVILVPTSVSRLRFDRYRTAITEDNGQFTIRGIAPGDYRLFAWQDLEPNAHLNLEFMRPYEDLGTAVHIEPGATGTVSLRLISTTP